MKERSEVGGELEGVRTPLCWWRDLCCLSVYRCGPGSAEIESAEVVKVDAREAFSVWLARRMSRPFCQ